jgi:hypothetical protein
MDASVATIPSVTLPSGSPDAGRSMKVIEASYLVNGLMEVKRRSA